MTGLALTTSEVKHNAFCVNLGMGILFFGIGAVQQFTTSWFKSIGSPEVGKSALLILYVTYFVSSWFSHHFVAQLGVRRCFLFSSCVYGLFVLTVAYCDRAVLYASAAFCGWAASLLWTGFFTFLNSIEDEKLRREESGRFFRYYNLGTFLGICLLSFLIYLGGFQTAFAIFALITLSSLFSFYRFNSQPVATKSLGRIQRWGIVAALAFTAVSSRLVYGLMFSSVPVDLAEITQTPSSLWMTSPFFLFPVLMAEAVSKGLNRWGTLTMAWIGFAATLGGLICFATSHEFAVFFLGILLAAFGSSIIYPIVSLLPRVLEDVNAGSVPRLSAVFSMSGSAGTMIGLLISRQLSGSTGYWLSLVVTAASMLIFLANLPRKTH